MTTKTACPSCRENGRDRSGDNLTVFPEGNTYCHACGYKGFTEERIVEKEIYEEPTGLTVEEINSYDTDSDPARELDLMVNLHFQTKVSYNETTGEVDSVYYPYYDGTEIVAYKQRRLGVPKKRAFQMIGKATTLFGDNPASPKMGQLLLVEGEEDALAAWHMLNVGIVPRDCAVMSLPNGAGLDKVTMAQHDKFKCYKQIFLCLDNDGAGQAAAHKLAPWLSRITKTRVVELDPAIGKDASDYLVAGRQHDFLKAIKDSKVKELKGLIAGSSLSLDDLLKPVESGYRIPFRGLHSAIDGLKKGELLTILAESGIGKSSFTKELSLALVEQDQRVVLMAMEEYQGTSAKALMALDMNIPLKQFKHFPPSKSECQPSFDKISKVFFLDEDEIDNMTVDKLLSTCTAYARDGNVDFIIIDHLGIALAKTPAAGHTSEVKQIDMFMQKLVDVIKDTGVGIIMVSHVKRGDSDAEHGREIKLTDARGSAAIEQYSYTVLGLERDQQSECDKEKNKLRVRVLKSRSTGYTGLCDFLVYDPMTGRIRNNPLPSPVVLEELKP